MLDLDQTNKWQPIVASKEPPSIIMWHSQLTSYFEKRTYLAYYVSGHLVCKGLRWIVNDDGLWQISAENVEILDVVSLDTDTMLPKQPVSKVRVGNDRKEGYIDKVRS